MHPGISSLQPGQGEPLSEEEIFALPAGMIVLCGLPGGSSRTVAKVTKPERRLFQAWGAPVMGEWGTPIVYPAPVQIFLPRLPRLSCNMTQEAVRARQKTVTRRLKMPRWAQRPGKMNWNAGEGPLVLIVDRSRPAPARRQERGQRARGLAVVELLHAFHIPLTATSSSEVEREGFPGMTPAAFIERFCQAQHCEPSARVARLEWRYL
jgi:hypothetical protein